MKAVLTFWRNKAERLTWFGQQQALSCIFPGILFLTFGATKIFSPDLPVGVYRYDLILLVCLLAQGYMVWTHLESLDEVRVIAVFHLLGLMLEIYKTHLGCWSYPEQSLFKLFGVPLYSGFMYASVASYLCQAWRRLNISLVHWPSSHLTLSLVVAIYVNFFTEQILPDARWLLAIVILCLFRRTRVCFGTDLWRSQMPLALSFVLMGFGIWVAENIATRLGAWQYPDQQLGWHVVRWQKISSWSLLVILSFILIVQLKHFKAKHKKVHFQQERLFELS